MLFADVIIDISVKSLDRPFQYIVPPEWADDILIGSQVEIPFGQGNRMLTGYVIGLSGESAYDMSKTKEIHSVVKKGVVAESHLLSLAYWLKITYGSTMSDAIRAVMPVKREIQEKVSRDICPQVSRDELLEKRNEFDRKHNVARVRLLDELLALSPEEFERGLDYDIARNNCKVSATVINGLVNMGILSVQSARKFRNPVSGRECDDERHKLNTWQAEIVDSITDDYLAGIRKTYLIHGVTGSGKTEIYMNIIERVVESGKQVIMLIPEIALTFQTMQRFYGRFGDRVSIMHSRLSAGERYDQYVRAKKGDIDIMIGPRSALFTPFERLGLIVVDEEHETSYQSEQPPKYNARHVAVHRAELLGASVVLGSATPSVESYYHAMCGEYKLFTLRERAGNASLPDVEIVDLRKELAEKNYSVFSRNLQEKIENCLKNKEQIMLFINRRGYAGFVSCRSCGNVLGCPHCSVALKPHKKNGKVSVLKCHYCGYEEIMPENCPECASKYIGVFGLGTQQVEEMLYKRFPGVRVLRMDADTTKGKEGHEKILKQFASGDADVMLGTQMIIKGHDFPNVTLVGVLAADLSLNQNDYSAAERTYQMLSQAAGRAGRGNKHGNVVFQTYQPEHYSVVCAAEKDYVKFYKREINVREMLQYPPISHILGVLVLSGDSDMADKTAEKLAELMHDFEEITVLGPVEAPIAKAKDIYRRMIYGKAKDGELLQSVKYGLETYISQHVSRREVSVQFQRC